MYPYLKLAVTLIKARSRSKLTIDDKSTLKFRAGVTDVDMFMELNHARYFTYMELARWDYGYRTGLLKLMKAQKWSFPIGGVSVRFRRRIPFRGKFTLTTQPICHDGRWFYFLQETHRNNEICSSALIKLAATSREGVVPAVEVLKHFDKPDWGQTMPGWITAWIEAESQRPWPTR